MFERQDPEDNDYLKVAEAAAAMHLPRMAVYELVHEGKLPAVSFGKSYRVPAQAVQEYLAAARHPEAPAPLHAPA
ncbi:helix-turn-helix domain-containing protein [Paeniglutamicibacter psychrophenolicus]|uniref:helix-turn-helix domain-containing protein n=1 Tax=Paeniglutamicibacter psychrophenolicus TaxID=257454 RepID=UPI002780954C|nr:helix-turn-helix domain-containing protein [Paeniglutamicibacter psychrophenolicus]MDQ0092769.1 excisionase family DNA binding protein [Paeniglutamicibacter psychrophenolicus]